MTAKDLIGQFEYVDIIDAQADAVPARIDTGARTTAIWASDISEADSVLYYVLFGEASQHFTGTRMTSSEYSKVVVANSSGHTQLRFKVPMTLRINGRRIKTFVTLTDRSTQAFPLLVGRNTLRGKFIVDVQNGPVALDTLDQNRSDELQSLL